MMDDLEEMLARPVELPGEPDVEGALAKARAAMARPSYKPRNYTGIATWIGVAAAVVIAVSVAHNKTSSPTYKTYSTQRAQRASITLSDGSQVILAPESRLIISSNFGYGDRSVNLSGQAYFSVVHSSDSPFTVNTGKSITRVLGTAFTVCAYPTDKTVRVAVAEGKVSIGNSSPSVVLLAGDAGSVTDNNPPQVTHDVKIADVFGWMHGRLTFEGTPFSEAIPELERTYGVNIVLGDSIIGRRDLRATISGESTSDMLDLIARILGARYERRGNTVTLTTSTTPVTR